MITCSTCNSLQVDENTNELPGETNWPGPERLETFALYVPIQIWANSAEAGCKTCRLIWDALLHFDRDLVLSLLGFKADSDDEQVQVVVRGKIGETLSAEFYPLPPGKHFGGVEFYASQMTSRPVSYPIIGTAAHVPPALELDRCLEHCRRWITACEQQHPRCMMTLSSSQRLPTRVLDLGNVDGSVKVRLYEPPPGSTASYIALSYCWGGVGNLTTTTSTIAERREEIPWALLPNLFRDAIQVTRGLGMRFLWIDSLCIIQDSTSDWEQEAKRMADIYENAFLTIAAGSAKDPTYGILTHRHTEWVSTADTMFKQDKPRLRRRYSVLDLNIPDAHDNKDCTIHVREPLRHNDIIMPRPYHDITYNLMLRAWTLQERLLARRTIHFTAFELIWECKETLFCECETIARDFYGGDDDHSPKIAYERALLRKIKEESHGGDDKTGGKQDKDQHPRWKESTKTWTRLAGGYSSRSLTYITDKLPAISGLARRFHGQESNESSNYSNNNNYLAGLWRYDLPWLLCWRAFERRYEQRTVDYCAPTWSWVSMATPVIWDNAILEATSRVEIIEAVTVPQGIDVFGRVSGGRISLRGRLQRATLDFQADNAKVLGLKNATGDRIFFVPDQNPNTTEYGQRFQEYQHDPPSKALQRTVYSMSHGDPVACLWVLHNVGTGAVYGLVLASPSEGSVSRSVPKSNAGYDVFERIGLVTATSISYQKDEISASLWFAGSKEESITMI